MLTLDTLERLARAATEGSWQWSREPEDIRALIRCFWKDNARIAEVVRDTDAAFITACDPDTILGLVQRVRALERVERAARARFEKWTTENYQELKDALDAITPTA